MIKIILALLISFSQTKSSEENNFKFWELLNKREREQFVTDSKVSKLAVDFYKGKFKASDDKRTEKLLSVLTNKNNFSPFYYYLFNKIVEQSDGALAESLGEYCVRMVVENPEYIINYFTYERKNYKKKQYLREIYALFIGSELSYHEENVSNIKYGFPEFKKILLTALPNINSDNKETLELFINEINITIKNMD